MFGYPILNSVDRSRSRSSWLEIKDVINPLGTLVPVLQQRLFGYAVLSGELIKNLRRVQFLHVKTVHLPSSRIKLRFVIHTHTPLQLVTIYHQKESVRDSANNGSSDFSFFTHMERFPSFTLFSRKNRVSFHAALEIPGKHIWIPADIIVAWRHLSCFELLLSEEARREPSFDPNGTFSRCYSQCPCKRGYSVSYGSINPESDRQCGYSTFRGTSIFVVVLALEVLDLEAAVRSEPHARTKDGAFLSTDGATYEAES